MAKRSPSVQVEHGVVIGNVYDKYGSRNPVERRLVGNFMTQVTDLVQGVDPESIHEVGCGEGHLSRLLAGMGYPVHGTDFSTGVIRQAREAGAGEDRQPSFEVASIYDLEPPRHAAELVVCCEVLEHLEEPERALDVLSELARPYLLTSVPREPIWRLANLARGKYLADLGNTPGHLQHWSKRGFLRFLRRAFVVEVVRTPLPWTMVLCRRPAAAP